jgi:hypothetical protein
LLQTKCHYIKNVNELNYVGEPNEDSDVALDNYIVNTSFSLEEVNIILTEIQEIN